MSTPRSASDDVISRLGMSYADGGGVAVAATTAGGGWLACLVRRRRGTHDEPPAEGS